MKKKSCRIAFIAVLALYLFGCVKSNAPDPANMIRVVTANPSVIEQRDAVSGGTISFIGAATPIAAFGICWSKTPTPTLADFKTVDSIAPNHFSSLLTGLTANTTYYVRAYATINTGTVYGNEFSFRSLQVVTPSVNLSNVDKVTQSTAQPHYTILSDGGGDITSKGVCWSTSPDPTISGSKTNDGAGVSGVAAALNGLAENTIYHVRAYASNALGTGYGQDVIFTTAIAGISLNLKTEIGSVIPNSDSTLVIGILSPVTLLPSVLSYGVCWSESPNPSMADSHSFGADLKQFDIPSQPGRGQLGNPNTSHASDLIFHSPVTGLQTGITYYCRVFVTTASGTGYGQMTSFIAQ